MHWIVLSDIHEHTEHLAAIAAEIRAAQLVVLAGDLTMFGGMDEARTVVSAVRDLNPRVAAVPGNTDHREVLEFLEAEGVSLHGRGMRVGEVAVYGVGGANPTPFRTPFELEEHQLEALLEEARDGCGDARTHVVVSHPPPFASGVDRLWSGAPVGSRAVRGHVERRRPALLVCGHIHEGRGVGAVQNTPVFNPGPLAAGGYIRIDVEGERVQGRLLRIPLKRGELALASANQLARKIRRLPRMRRR